MVIAFEVIKKASVAFLKKFIYVVIDRRITPLIASFYIETNEAFPDRETNPTDFDKLEGYNPNRPRICSPKQLGQINARPRKCLQYIPLNFQ